MSENRNLFYPFLEERISDDLHHVWAWPVKQRARSFIMALLAARVRQNRESPQTSELGRSLEPSEPTPIPPSVVFPAATAIVREARARADRGPSIVAGYVGADGRDDRR
jgi:hypothetical protein